MGRRRQTKYSQEKNGPYRFADNISLYFLFISFYSKHPRPHASHRTYAQVLFHTLEELNFHIFPESPPS